jgi:sugar lactone lactonase YvrE
MLLALAALGLVLCPAGAGAANVSGTVVSGRLPLRGFEVTLYRSDASGPLATTTTGANGAFGLTYEAPRSDGTILYLIARHELPGPARGAVALVSILGRHTVPARVVVNERTTVAAAFSMARFIRGSRIAGPRPGLQNAAGMVRNLVNPRTGELSRVLTRAPNGRKTSSVRTFNSLADMIAACVRSRSRCPRLLRLTAPPGGKPPGDTLEAMVNVAHLPAHRRRSLFLLSRSARVYAPARGKPPSAWTVVLRFVGDGRTMSGPGNFAIDAKGSLWVTNNFEYARRRRHPVCGSQLLLRFTPRGRFYPGSPYRGGGLNGAGFGIGIDPTGHVWVGNFGFAAPVPGCPQSRQPPSDSISEFTSAGRALSPDRLGYRAGGISWAQGTVSDRSGNIWIANCGNNTVTRSPAGHPEAALGLSGLGLEKPFDVAIGDQGLVFVSGNGNSQVAVLNNDGSPARAPVSGSGLNRPLGVAADSRGYVWVANSGVIEAPCPGEATSGGSPGGTLTLLDPTGAPVNRSGLTGGGLTVPWGITVDGDDNVWVANFAGSRLSEFCGTRPSYCPPGTATGQAISPRAGYGFDGLVRNTGVAVDPSGNVWLTNNYKRDPGILVDGQYTLQNPGGYQIVAYVGLAAPVKTPVIGPVRRP